MKRQLTTASKGMKGLAGALMLASVMALAACETSGTGATTASTATQASERPASRDEIASVAVGKTINGAMTYNADGSYLFRGGNPGRYTIRAGRICIRFESGGSRCDRIVTTDGDSFTMINSSGERFPFG